MSILTPEEALQLPPQHPERLALMRQLSASPAEADQARYRQLYYDAIRQATALKEGATA